MAKHCEICGKVGQMGSMVSHSKVHTNRRWEPNLQRVKAKVNGVVTHIWACTRCIRSGKVEKP